MASAFSGQEVLREIGALDSPENPRVDEIAGSADWSALECSDVVVGIPQTLSRIYKTNPPPKDFFDLVIVDEAHHAPAPTWLSILTAHERARRVLLSATPQRRDGKRVPGSIVFHYPLKLAIEDGSFQRVEPEILSVPAGAGQDLMDEILADRTLELLRRREHASSALLVRASSRERAKTLASLYSSRGQPVAVLTSNLGERTKSQIIDGLRSGRVRAVAVVGMLGEGFDLPRLRIVAYHDKHKTTAPTVQLIGRLVRASAAFPQPSHLVALRDIDTYPALEDAARALYEEDADWGSLLPRIIDEEIEESIADREFSARLPAAPSELSVDAMRAPVRAHVFEARHKAWSPDFVDAARNLEGSQGRLGGGHEVYYVAVTPDDRTLVLVTSRKESPSWHHHAGLDSVRFDLHLFTWVPAPRDAPGRLGMWFSNSDSGDVTKYVRKIVDVEAADIVPARPERLQAAFDALPRVSVSNVGVRNTYAGSRGTASYKMFAGAGVDRGMRETDTAQGAIGHAMAQVRRADGSGAFNAGIAVERAKFWESRSVGIRTYIDLLGEFCDRYWASPDTANPLLPEVARGRTYSKLPTSRVVVTELDPWLLGRDWTLGDDLLENAQVSALADGSAGLRLSIRYRVAGETREWQAEQDVNGVVRPVGADVHVRRGTGQMLLSDLLDAHPVTVFFSNGRSIHGATMYERPGVPRSVQSLNRELWEWNDVNISKETDSSAARAGSQISVQSAVREHIRARVSGFEHKWLLHNDGKGEFADLITLEVNLGAEVRAEFWHVKPAGGAPSVRVTDFEVVVAQAIKSRRWFTDPSVWQEMSRRLAGSGTKLTVVEGDAALLGRLLKPATEETPWTLIEASPALRGDVVIAQPGLSWTKLLTELAAEKLLATQVRDLLAVFHDAVGNLASPRLVCSGPLN